MINIDFYSFCFINKPPKIQMQNQHNLMLGSAIHHYYSSDYIHDDTGDNISILNHWFGQTTGLYWVWKNSKSKHIGICTYRLFWNEIYLKEIPIQDNVLIVPKSIDVNYSVPNNKSNDYSIFTQFIHCHGDLPMSFLYYLSKINKIEIKPSMIDDLSDQRMLHPFNMFIASKRVYDKICEILFDTLFKIHNYFSYLFDSFEKQTGQKRILDFLAERILHIIYNNIEYFVPDTKIYECEVINLPH